VYNNQLCIISCPVSIWCTAHPVLCGHTLSPERASGLSLCSFGLSGSFQ
jgi:hypothetical protein